MFLFLFFFPIYQSTFSYNSSLANFLKKDLYLFGNDCETAMQKEEDYRKINSIFDNNSLFQDIEKSNFELNNGDNVDFCNNFKNCNDNGCAINNNGNIDTDDSHDNDDNGRKKFTHSLFINGIMQIKADPSAGLFTLIKAYFHVADLSTNCVKRFLKKR